MKTWGRISLCSRLRTENFAISFHHIFFSPSFCIELFPEYSCLTLANSADALAEAKEALANTGNAQILREENQELFQENRKLKSDLESAQRLLETAQ